MNARTLVRLAAGVFLASGTGAALAAEISMIEASATNVTLDGGKVVVRFTVSGTAAAGDHCGYFVEFSDGMAGDSRIINNENGRFSRWHEHNFNNPGTYRITAHGKKVKSTGGCDGTASTTVTVAAAAGPAKAGRTATAPSCPEGWMLNEKSVNWRTGAFSCSPKPSGQLVCADGLRYYERDGIIGCRQDRRNEQSRYR